MDLQTRLGEDQHLGLDGHVEFFEQTGQYPELGVLRQNEFAALYFSLQESDRIL